MYMYEFIFYFHSFIWAYLIKVCPLSVVGVLVFTFSTSKTTRPISTKLAQSILGGLQKTHSAQKPFGQLQEHVVLIQVQTNRDPQGYDRATMVSWFFYAGTNWETSLKIFSKLIWPERLKLVWSHLKVV